MISYYSDAPVAGAFPSPTATSAFTNNLSQAANQQVAGVQTEMQQPPPTEPEKGPTLPTPKPSPSPKESPSPSPSPTPAPSASPESSSSPTPTPEPSATPDNRPKITNLAESDITSSSIKFKFSVDKSSDCKAIYWTDSNNKKEQDSSTKRTTSPEITITGLTASTEYKYNIECKDTENNQTSTIGEYKFKTT